MISALTRPAFVSVLVAAVLTAAACGGAASSAGGASSPAASATASSASGEVAEDLTFTGALSGHMSSAHRGDTYVCAGGSGSFVAAPIVGEVGGKEVTLSITKISFHGAGTYEAGGVGFDVGSDHYFPTIGNPGTLVVASDLRSGTVDMDLAVNSDPNTRVGHVSGSWRCPADAF